MMKIKRLILLFIAPVWLQSCDYFSNPNDKMIKILEARKMMYNVKRNAFASGAEVAYYDSIIKNSYEGFFKISNEINKGNALLKFGRESESVTVLENAIRKQKEISGQDNPESLKYLAIAYMRLGEKQNCVNHHNPESCIMPIQ